MPGQRNSSNVNAQFLYDWAIYRAGVVADDDPLNPGLVTETINATQMPSVMGLQIWLTPQRVSGTGTVDLTLIQSGYGSLAPVVPFKQAAPTLTAVAHLEEKRVLQLIPGTFRVLMTGMDPGSEWNLHFTMTST